MKERGITVEIAWFDDDMLELRVGGTNGVFSGETRLYAGHDALAKLGEFAKGFPGKDDDRRLIQLGTFDPGFAGGGARLGLRCLDGAKHVALDVMLATQPENNRHQRAEFWFEVEPAALETFSRQVQGLERKKGARASLPAAT